MSGTGRSGPSKKRPLEDGSLTGTEDDSRHVRKYHADEDEEMAVEEEEDSNRVC
jgi:hypothetical protein